MSSKNVDRLAAASGSARPAWSIVRRLAWVYTLSVSLLLTATGLALYFFLESNLRSEDQQLLTDKIRILRLILKERPEDPTAFEEELLWEGEARQFNKYYARILDESFQTILETPGMATLLPADIFSAPMSLDRSQAVLKSWEGAAGSRFLLAGAWAALGDEGRPRRVIQVALEVSKEAQLLASYRNKMIPLLLLAIGLAAFVGVIMSRRGLKPIADITAAVQSVTAAQLDDRIRERDWPKELTTLAREFDQMLARLQDSFNRLSQFSANIAHELRTPINNLMGEAQVALSRPREAADYRQVLESSLEEYQRLNRMIESLLFLARSENAETELKRVTAEARPEVESILEYFEIVASERGIALTCEGNARIWVDLTLFRRALNNLVSNALNFTATGGQVIVTLGASPGDGAEIKVRDTGCGIEARHLPWIFDRFYQVDPARSKANVGTGLGLAIVKTIVELHQGTVQVASEVGQGTTFTMRFPR